MATHRSRQIRRTLLAAPLAFAPLGVLAQAGGQPNRSGEPIRIGMTAPLSGPASAYGQIAKTAAGYIRKINDEGGINGRKVEFIVADDGYSPPKTVEQTRRLVESEEVLAMFAGVGSGPNGAVQKYLNTRKVPQIFIGSGATKWDNPKEFPYTVPWQPNFIVDAAAYTAYIDQAVPGAKAGILFQDDDFGKDNVASLQNALGSRFAQMVVAQQSYATSDPTVDSQVITLKGSGANVVFLYATPKFAAQAIRKIAEIGWKPLVILAKDSAGIKSTLVPAGTENAKGVISTRYLKDASEPGLEKDTGYQEYAAFMARYVPEADRLDFLNVYAYSITQTLVHVLRQCGSDVSRENILRQATSLHDLALPMLASGIRIGNDPARYTPIRKLQLMRFDGSVWVPFGDLVGG